MWERCSYLLSLGRASKPCTLILLRKKEDLRKGPARSIIYRDCRRAFRRCELSKPPAPCEDFLCRNPQAPAACSDGFNHRRPYKKRVGRFSGYALLTARVFRTQHPRRCWDVSKTCTLACCSSKKKKGGLGQMIVHASRIAAGASISD